MAGINARVQVFLDSWPIVKEQLDRLLEDENGKKISKRERIRRVSWNSTTDDLQQDQPGQFPHSMQEGLGKGEVGKKSGG